jgi:hypothetical protein
MYKSSNFKFKLALCLKDRLLMQSFFYALTLKGNGANGLSNLGLKDKINS